MWRASQLGSASMSNLKVAGENLVSCGTTTVCVDGPLPVPIGPKPATRRRRGDGTSVSGRDGKGFIGIVVGTIRVLGHGVALLGTEA